MTAEEIKALRKKLNLTQNQMAQQLGVARLTIINWEAKAGRPSHLALRQLHRLERKGM